MEYALVENGQVTVYAVAPCLKYKVNEHSLPLATGVENANTVAPVSVTSIALPFVISRVTFPVAAAFTAATSE